MTEELFTPWVDYKIERGSFRGADNQRIGLRLLVRARPEIEDYMRQLSNDRRVPAESYADQWFNVKGDPFEVYVTEEMTKGVGSKHYSIDAVGHQMILFNQVRHAQPARNQFAVPAIERHSNEEGVINLSFLRTVGISNEEGVCFGFVGAFSKDYVDTLKHQLPYVTKQFLQDYIVPISVNLQIISRS